MQYRFWLAVAFSLLAELALAAGHIQPGLHPLPTEPYPVWDEARVLTPLEGRKLAQAVEAASKEAGVAIVMLIMETTAPESVEDYTNRLAKLWRETEGLEPSRMIFVVVLTRDRELEVLPGKSLGSLTQSFRGTTLFSDLGPLFRERRYFDALMGVTSRLLKHILAHKKIKA